MLESIFQAMGSEIGGTNKKGPFCPNHVIFAAQLVTRTFFLPDMNFTPGSTGSAFFQVTLSFSNKNIETVSASLLALYDTTV